MSTSKIGVDKVIPAIQRSQRGEVAAITPCNSGKPIGLDDSTRTVRILVALLLAGDSGHWEMAAAKSLSWPD